jgi:hypothetical protein
VPRDAVDAAVVSHGVGAKRSDGKLPAHVSAYLTMALCLFADDDYTEVATKVTGSLSRWGCWDAAWSVPTASGITQARKRLGPKVLAEVFEQVAAPVSTMLTRGAWLRRWRLVAIDGFEIDGVRYGPPRSGPTSPFHTTERDERKVRLAGVVHQIGTVFGYTYDFGDSWQHVIEIEDVADPDTDTRRAACVAGERACPPEDCGGVPGYYHLLEAADNPDDEFTERFGHGFDPERFDLDLVNRRLGHVLR